MMLALALSGCSKTTRVTLHTSPTLRICATLADPDAPGTMKFSLPSAATVNADYGHYDGVEGFLKSVRPGESILFCSLDSPAPSLHGCNSGRTMFLVTSVGQDKLKLPCGAEPGVPRTEK